MNILLVSAHDDPKSLVASLHNSALSVFERKENCTITVSDLYAQGFNPLATGIDFKTSSGVHANYMFEQQRSVNTGSGFSPDILAEMDKVRSADLIIFHFPLWWGGMPAILKGWFDRVFAMGFAWNADARYGKGLLKGKKALLCVSAGDPSSYYSADGMHRATVEQHLYSVSHNTLAYCGLDVLKPFVLTNTTAGDREELENGIASYRKLLETIEQSTEYTYKNS